MVIKAVKENILLEIPLDKEHVENFGTIDNFKIDVIIRICGQW
jgi:hypothetical protein